jgi:hypothetical protein
MMFSHQELRAAVEALDTIERFGHEVDFSAALLGALADCPATDPLDNSPIGSRIAAGLLADRLAKLLGVPLGDCEAAAAEVFGRSRRRAVFEAIVGYAAEIRGERPKRKPAGATEVENVPPLEKAKAREQAPAAISKARQRRAAR